MDARQLTGVVIISLPPGDDPSKGKTITAFTVSDDCDHLPSSPPTAASSSAPSSAAVIHRSRVSPKVKKNVAAAALSLSLIFFFIWSGLFAEAPVQLLSGNEGDGRPRRSSFVLPLYSKNRDTGGNGTFRLVASVKVAVSSKSSSSVIPIRGSLLPDGYSVFPFPTHGLCDCKRTAFHRMTTIRNYNVFIIYTRKPNILNLSLAIDEDKIELLEIDDERVVV
ncbi:hypothetical protein HPP92_023161 [Vanilla planifolia]|uniref:Uncharacterized protein n=1 Tax=Vanilla planifolia TaxID=51239 RepID=A0A835PW31_VANPL|nr:hypothetical protein HPP92_023161 [Vanilla planifolia]